MSMLAPGRNAERTFIVTILSYGRSIEDRFCQRPKPSDAQRAIICTDIAERRRCHQSTHRSFQSISDRNNG